MLSIRNLETAQATTNGTGSAGTNKEEYRIEEAEEFCDKWNKCRSHLFEDSTLLTIRNCTQFSTFNVYMMPHNVLKIGTLSHFIFLFIEFNAHLSDDMTKPTKWVCAQRRQISLGIRPVWSESSLSAWRNLGSLAVHCTHSEDSDQTWRMPRLICLRWAHTHFVGFVMSWLMYYFVLDLWLTWQQTPSITMSWFSQWV